MPHRTNNAPPSLPTPPGVGISEWLAATYQVGWTYRRQYQLCRKAGMSKSCAAAKFKNLCPQQQAKADWLSQFGAGFYICGMDERMLCASKHCRELCNRIQAANAELSDSRPL